MNKLLIVESPGKVAKLTEMLGTGWTVAASVGHIRDLPKKGLGVEAPHFTPQYELTERGEGVVQKLRALVGKADAVYLATDPDREGESIAWHLQQVLRLPNPHRCTFNDINPGPVKAAVANPRTIDMAMVSAQETRRILDRLVGYRVTAALSQTTGTLMPAGRVQSPAVRIVVEREAAIEGFKPTTHYGVKAHFEGGWSAEWDTRSIYKDEPHYCLDLAAAQRIAALATLTVTAANDKSRDLAPYPPFTTSTMQQAASARLKMNPALTMETAQKLYEQGAITYHRTDSPNLSADGFTDIAAYGATIKLPIVNAQRMFKAKADAQMAHEAIRPSHIEDESKGTTDVERALYQLIRLRTLASQLPAARFAVREATLTGQVGAHTISFIAKGEQIIDRGWTSLYGEDEKEDAESSNPIPKLTAGQALAIARTEVLDKKTRAPKRYTEASLIKELETQGIGRPSTYAAIIQKIIEHEYIRVEKQSLFATERAKALIASLVGKMSFIELGFTRDMETQLDQIAERKATYADAVARINTTLDNELHTLPVRLGPGAHACPVCKNPLQRRKGEHGFFWSCSDINCKTTLPDDKGKPGARKAPAVVSQHRCPTCGKGLIHRQKPGEKNGYNFWGCSGFPDCKTSVPDKAGSPDFAAPKGAHAKPA